MVGKCARAYRFIHSAYIYPNDDRITLIASYHMLVSCWQGKVVPDHCRRIAYNEFACFLYSIETWG